MRSCWNLKKLQKESYSSVEPLPKSQITMIRGRAAGRRNTHVSRYRSEYLERIETKSNGDQAKSAPKYMRNQMANLSANGSMWDSSSRKALSYIHMHVRILLEIQRFGCIIRNPNRRQPKSFPREFSPNHGHFHENSRGTELEPREISWFGKFVV